MEELTEKARALCAKGCHEHAVKQYTEALALHTESQGGFDNDYQKSEPFLQRLECFRDHLGAYPMYRRTAGMAGGFAVIVSMEKDRPGGQLDRGSIKQALITSGCTVEEMVDPQVANVKANIRILMNNVNFSIYDWFVCVIMAHGQVVNNRLQFLDSESQPISFSEDVVMPFRDISGLRGKPKVFVVQACRTVSSEQAPEEMDEESPDLEHMAAEVKGPDMLICYATLHGTRAERSATEGAPFIQGLCTELSDTTVMATVDVVEVMHRVAAKSGRCTPVITSTLKSKLFWRAGLPPIPDAAVTRRVTHKLPVRQNLDFRGRDVEMEKIRSLLEDPGKGIVCIWAMAGMGKSQLMVEYAHQHLQRYDRVLWVDGGPQPVLRANFASLAHDPLALPLPVGQGEDGEELAQKEVRRFLERMEHRCLFLLDNVDEEDDVFPLVPASGNSHVIITTKKKEGLQHWPSLELKELTEADAWALVTRGREFPDDEAKALRCLCTELANHTLALAVAAGILAKGAMKPSILLSQLQARGEWSGGAVDPGFSRPARLKALFDESLAAMERGGSERGASRQALVLAKKMALAGGWFAPTTIRIPLLLCAVKKAGRKGREEDLVGIADEAVSLLVEYSLAVANEKGVQFHRLVGNYMRHRTPNLWRAAAEAVTDVGVVAADVEHFRFVWERFAERSHSQALVFNIVNWVGLPLAWHTGVNLYQFQEAERVRGNCVELIATQCTHNLRRHIRSLFWWHRRDTRDMDLLSLDLQETKGAILFSQGRFKDAEDKFRAMLTVRERLQGIEHPSTLWTRENLAVAADSQGRCAEAEGEFRAVLAVRERVLGAQHPHTLWTRNNLAVAAENQGRYAEAEEEYRAVLAVRERVLGAEHPDTLDTRNNLAVAAKNQGRYAEAEGEYRAVLAVRERVLGAAHPDTLLSRLRLAYIILKQVGRGSSVASAEDIGILLADVSKGLPLLPASERVADTLNEIAWQIQKVDGTRHLQQAEILARRSVEISKTISSDITARVLDTLAAVLHKQGKTGEALMFAREAVGLASQDGWHYGEDEPEAIRATLCKIEAEASLSQGQEEGC